MSEFQTHTNDSMTEKRTGKPRRGKLGERPLEKARDPEKEGGNRQNCEKGSAFFPPRG